MSLQNHNDWWAFILKPGRDPRGHVISVAFLMSVRTAFPKPRDDAAAAEFVADWRSKKLAFDHGKSWPTPWLSADARAADDDHRCPRTFAA